MYSKGTPHNNGPNLAKYLITESEGIECAEVVELRGFAADNIYDALALGQLMASGTRCQNPFFHAYIRLPAGEALSREQWRYTADRIERQLGFKNQPRAIVFHLKDGDEHMHLVWSRIGKDMKAIDPGLYKNKLKEISRVLEKELGLKQIGNERDPDEKTKAASRPEFEESRRLKTNLKAIRETIRECWDMSDNGRSFTASLEEKGLILAQGDERDFVIVDHAGGIHALSKRITGAAMKDSRNRLADLDRKKLPDVDQARSMQRERGKKSMPDQEGLEAEERKKKAIDREEEQKQEAIEKEEDRKREEGEKEENRKLQAGLDEEQRKENAMKEEARKREAIREEQQKEATFKEAQNAKAQEEQQKVLAEQIERLKQKIQAEEIELRKQYLNDYFGNLDHRSGEARNTGAEETAAAKELTIRDASSRYGQALAQHYDMRNPTSSLARSAMAEYGAFLRDRENIDHQIARVTDPMERKGLELQKRIEYAEYMAITSTRIAQQSDIVWGKKVIVKEGDKEKAKLVSEDGEAQRAKAAKHQIEAQALRKEFRELQKTRLIQERPETPRNPTPHHDEPEPMVEERVTGQQEWKTQPFSGFVKTVQSRQPEKDVTHEDQKRDPSLRNLYFEGIVFKQRRDSSLEQIREDLKAGRSLDAADLRNLTRDELQKVRHWGHEHLKNIVQEHTRQRDLDRER